jgi:thiol-disulfide isomerase/thioredoxin
MYRKHIIEEKLAFIGFLICFLALGFAFAAEAATTEHPILYFFWGDGCPHCEKEKEFLQTLQKKYPELEIRSFETWKHANFTQLADAMRQAYNIKTSSVPMTFIGNWSITGFRSDEITGIDLEEQVVACIQQGCIDGIKKIGPRNIAWLILDQVAKGAPVGWDHVPATIPPRKDKVFHIQKPASQSETSSDSSEASANSSVPSPQSQNNTSTVNSERPSQTANSPKRSEMISLPLIGNVNVTQTGLPLFTLIIGGLDGFNPCAMWVLCFLLTLVIYAKSRAKILLIGGIFVVASGVIYFLFMAAWLNLFMFVGYVKPLQIAVGLVAVVMGLINCKDFFFFKQGVSLTISESAQPKLFKMMRKVINASAIPGMILGTLVLAVTANLIELLCTAGFPAIYTRILTLQDLSVTQYYLYLALYNVVYVIPLAVIVSIFAWRMGGRKLSEREGRILKLVGGVLMLTLGIILLVNPQILMFG